MQALRGIDVHAVPRSARFRWRCHRRRPSDSLGSSDAGVQRRHTAAAASSRVPRLRGGSFSAGSRRRSPSRGKGGRPAAGGDTAANRRNGRGRSAISRVGPRAVRRTSRARTSAPGGLAPPRSAKGVSRHERSPRRAGPRLASPGHAPTAAPRTAILWPRRRSRVLPQLEGLSARNEAKLRSGCTTGFSVDEQDQHFARQAEHPSWKKDQTGVGGAVGA